jgi:hypothetical protein
MFAGSEGFRVHRSTKYIIVCRFGGLISEFAPMHGLFRGD